jgi:hypothetical protein
LFPLGKSWAQGESCRVGESFSGAGPHPKRVPRNRKRTCADHQKISYLFFKIHDDFRYQNKQNAHATFAKK